MSENANDILSGGNSKPDPKPESEFELNEVVADRLKRDEGAHNLNDINDDTAMVRMSKLHEVVGKVNNSFAEIEKILIQQNEQIRKNTDSIMSIQRKIVSLENRISSQGGNFSI